jgi:hypothetical protein
MVTVAEAASALGIDERTVREKLSKDEWKGEKRLIGMKEKWFMYRGELDRQVERLRILRPQERVSTQGLDGVFDQGDQSDQQSIDAQTIEVHADNSANEKLSIAFDEVLTKLTEQFSKQLNAEKDVVYTLKRELEDKDRQLRLLPDYQRQADDERKAAELKEMEAQALRKQILAMEEAQSRAELEAERILSEKEAQVSAVQLQLQALTQSVEELKQPWWRKWFSSNQPS